MHFNAIDFGGREGKARTSQDVLEPSLRRRGVAAGAHESIAPREKVQAAPSVFFPRQHAEGDVVMVLKAGQVSLLSITSSDV
jgi:hypothetical protein